MRFSRDIGLDCKGRVGTLRLLQSMLRIGTLCCCLTLFSGFFPALAPVAPWRLQEYNVFLHALKKALACFTR